MLRVRLGEQVRIADSGSDHERYRRRVARRASPRARESAISFPITGTSPDIRHITPQRRTAPSHHTAPPRPHHRTPRLRNAAPHRTALRYARCRIHSLICKPCLQNVRQRGRTTPSTHHQPTANSGIKEKQQKTTEHGKQQQPIQNTGNHKHVGSTPERTPKRTGDRSGSTPNHAERPATGNGPRTYRTRPAPHRHAGAPQSKGRKAA